VGLSEKKRGLVTGAEGLVELTEEVGRDVGFCWS